MRKCNILYPIFVVLALVISSSACSKKTEFTKAQIKEIQRIVHDYLVKNPNVLVEASQTLQKQQMHKAKQASESAISKYSKDIFDSTGKPVAGNPDGDIVMVEFFDYQCPICQAMKPVVDKTIKANPNLKVIYAEFPYIGGSASRYAAEAAIASMKQRKYGKFHSAMFKKAQSVGEGNLTNKHVIDVAKSVGLNIGKLQADMKDKNIDKQFADNLDLAKKIRLIGTPAFAIGNLKKNKFRYIDGMTSPKDVQQAINDVK